jgi:hypothetical protein
MKTFLLTIFISACTLAGLSQNLQGRSPSLSSQITDDNSLSELKIYPNPCKDAKVTVEFTSKQITEVQLINIAGKEVLQKTFTYPENKKQIELNGIPNGIYLVRIKTDDQKLVTKKLMVSKN